MRTDSVVPLAPRPRPTLRLASSRSALDVLLAAGQIGEREHAAGLAYGGLRRRYKAASHSTGRDGAMALGNAAWAALSCRHAALLRAAGHDRFLLDRLCLDDDAPLACEVGRVREALERVRKVQGRDPAERVAAAAGRA